MDSGVKTITHYWHSNYVCFTI